MAETALGNGPRRMCPASGLRNATVESAVKHKWVLN